MTALVDATATSGPDRVNSDASLSGEIVEPTVLVTASTQAFCARACRSASSVSAVSPLWLMAMTSVPRPTTGSR